MAPRTQPLPPPPQPKPLPPKLAWGARLDPTGAWVSLTGPPETASHQSYAGLWVLEIATGKLECLARGRVWDEYFRWDERAPRLHFRSGLRPDGERQAWLAQPEGGHWRVSPDPLEAGPDPTREVSPDGKWTAFNRTSPDWSRFGEEALPASLTLVNNATQARKVFPRWNVAGWAPGQPYLWCRSASLHPPAAALHIVDLRSLKEVATLGPAQMHGLGPELASFSPRGDLVLLNGRGLGANPPEGWLDVLVARPDGSGLRSLRPLGVRPWEPDLMGWTQAGDLLAGLHETGTLITIDPRTGARRVIYPPGASAQEVRP